jgi:hypothetical protein
MTAPAPEAAPFIWLFFFVFASGASFLTRRRQHNAVGWPLDSLVDRIWGPGATTAFTTRVRPVRLMMLASLTFGTSGLASTYANAQAWGWAYFQSGFFLSVGLGLLVAYLFSLKFPPSLN